MFVVFIVLCAFPVFAEEYDSMALFHSPKQVIVVVNEQGGMKLGPLMDAFSNADELNLASKSGDISISCRRAYGAHSCTFKFSPSERVAIEAHKMFALSDTEDSSNIRVKDPINLGFINSFDDHFTLAIDSFQVTAETIKK